MKPTKVASLVRNGSLLLVLLHLTNAGAQSLEISSLSDDVGSSIDISLDSMEKFTEIDPKVTDPKDAKRFSLTAFTPILASDDSLDVYGAAISANAFKTFDLQLRILSLKPLGGSSFNQYHGSLGYRFETGDPKLNGSLSLSFTDTENFHETSKVAFGWKTPVWKGQTTGLSAKPEIVYRYRSFEEADSKKDWGGSLSFGWRFPNSSTSLNFRHQLDDAISDQYSSISLAVPWSYQDSKLSSVFTIDSNQQLTLVLSIPL